MKTGTELIADERQRQIEVEGWTPEHDSIHTDEELCYAAKSYIESPHIIGIPPNWPWDFEWFKTTPNDRVRELVKAGALIAAEIDRLQNQTTGTSNISRIFEVSLK